MRWEVSCGADFLEDCSRILMNSQDGYQRLGHIQNNSAYTLGCPIFTFFLIELSSLNHSGSWVVGVHKKNFSVIDQNLTFRERFSFLHFLQGKKGPK